MLINSGNILTKVSILNAKSILQFSDFQTVYLIVDINDKYSEKNIK
jgi:hypothetical protein